MRRLLVIGIAALAAVALVVALHATGAIGCEGGQCDAFATTAQGPTVDGYGGTSSHANPDMQGGLPMTGLDFVVLFAGAGLVAAAGVSLLIVARMRGERAVAAELRIAGVRAIVDATVPPGTVEVRNPDGSLAGRIVNIDESRPR